jgi:4-methoxybenzoate monooxygenase (O-demethylating)
VSIITETPVTHPTSQVDPFSTEFLRDPYPYHEQLRETGPVLWLDRYGIWAMARYDEVKATLNDWETFCSSAGAGMSDFRREKPWRPPSIILEADPPLHTKTRGVLTRILSPAAIRDLRTAFQADAERMLEPLIARGTFDGMKDFAEKYPVKVFPDAVGLPEEGRENLLPYGSMAFNAFGPRNELLQQAMATAQPVIDWIMSKCNRRAISPDGLGAQIFAAADAGELTENEAALLLRSFLTAGMDTTVNGIGNALFCFATHPEQWQRLRSNPTLVRGAFEEVLRFESPVQTFFRTTTRPIVVAGTKLDQGQKVLLFLGAANRDPRKWENADRFDVTRKATGHVAFGTGIHGCVGQAMARLEGDIVLTTLAKRVANIELAGKPEWRLNNTLHGLRSLPLRLTAA